MFGEIITKKLVFTTESHELIKTKYRFEIVEFTHNITYQTGFENSTGNT